MCEREREREREENGKAEASAKIRDRFKRSARAVNRRPIVGDGM